MSQGSLVEQALEKWAVLSREYGITIVAGSYFVPHVHGGGTIELRNRAFVVTPDRGVVYHQDKVFLTDFEREICGLSPGRVEKGGFDLQGRRVVMTLCRDTFFPVWEQVFNHGVDLWIDIKANGVAFDKEQEEIFQRALPARLSDTQIPYGLTVCLTGRYLDLFWEGRSSFIKGEEGSVFTLVESKTIDKEEVLVYQIP
jgi:predicted amidohydrolase